MNNILIILIPFNVQGIGNIVFSVYVSQCVPQIFQFAKSGLMWHLIASRAGIQVWRNCARSDLMDTPTRTSGLPNVLISPPSAIPMQSFGVQLKPRITGFSASWGVPETFVHHGNIVQRCLIWPLIRVHNVERRHLLVRAIRNIPVWISRLLIETDEADHVDAVTVSGWKTTQSWPNIFPNSIPWRLPSYLLLTLLLYFLVKTTQSWPNISPNSIPWRLPSYLLFTLLLYSLFIFYLPGSLYWILLLYLLRLPCHFYLVVIEQQQLFLGCAALIFIITFFIFKVRYEKCSNLYIYILLQTIPLTLI